MMILVALALFSSFLVGFAIGLHVGAESVLEDRTSPWYQPEPQNGSEDHVRLLGEYPGVTPNAWNLSHNSIDWTEYGWLHSARPYDWERDE